MIQARHRQQVPQPELALAHHRLRHQPGHQHPGPKEGQDQQQIGHRAPLGRALARRQGADPRDVGEYERRQRGHEGDDERPAADALGGREAPQRGQARGVAPLQHAQHPEDQGLHEDEGVEQRHDVVEPERPPEPHDRGQVAARGRRRPPRRPHGVELAVDALGVHLGHVVHGRVLAHGQEDVLERGRVEVEVLAHGLERLEQTRELVAPLEREGHGAGLGDVRVALVHEVPQGVLLQALGLGALEGLPGPGRARAKDRRLRALGPGGGRGPLGETQRLGRVLGAERHAVAAAEAPLQEADRAVAPHPPGGHDRHPVSQRLGLVHVVRREEQGALAPHRP
mmetsp:Transcript_8384/g.25186  ORF Transcript_8384/g.25186 Transcript_8384/m.25186 type:complete len:340 (+) Transcript_8384:290-1309(+)